MRPSKIAILAAVGLLVFGSAGFFGYSLFLKPYASHKSFFHHKTTAVAKPTPDPSVDAFNAVVALQNTGKLLEAQTAWLAWLEAHPNSPKIAEAMVFLGKANMELLCSPSSMTNKERYTVIKGDSLDRIARKQKSNAELIQRINGLSNINLQIGQVLLIPQLKTSIDIDREATHLTLRDHDQFLKSYTLLSFPRVGSQKAPLETTILDRIAIIGNKRTAFGDKKYPLSEQMILLRSGGNIVTAPMEAPSTAAATAPVVTNNTLSMTNTAAASSNTVTATTSTNAVAPVMPAGFVISPADMKEIFPFITKDTPVSIH